ncbi:MAG TPA: hypothetical protein ENK23_04020 [Sorangium sp.]|nr:hypothetical protein [Sorangium sp.]
MDSYVARLGRNGCSWSMKLGDSKVQSIESIASESGDVVVAGRFAGTLDFGGATLASGGGLDAFVAKLGEDGHHIWSRRFGDQGGVVSSIRVAVHPLGTVMLSGLFQGSIDFGGGVRKSTRGPDLFVVKLNPAGEHLWSTTITEERMPCSLDDCTLDRIDMATDSDGSLVLTGHYKGEIDFGGSVLRNTQTAIYIAKLDVNGTLLWSGDYGSSVPVCSQPECVALAAVGSDHNIVIGGQYRGAMDFGAATIAADEDGGSFVMRLSR